ncbi:MAG: glycosyltransferase family 2 protein [Paludibacter sp.]
MIDILLSTYNSEKYLMQQVQSYFNQTYSNWRLIIRDDGSTDDTLKVSNKLAETYPEKIIIYSGENIGTIKSFEWLLEKSDADYIMLSDHDDVWMDNKIEDTLLKMSDMEIKFPEKPLLVFTDLKVVDEDLDLVNDSFWKYSRLDVKLASDFNYLGVCNCINACTIMINKNAKEICLPFSDNAKMHDAWIALKICKYGEIGYVEKATILYRQHSKNLFGANKEEIKTTTSYLTSRVKSLTQVINGNRKQFELLKELDYGNVFKYLVYKSLYFFKVRYK